MGEATDIIYGIHEKVGIRTGPDLDSLSPAAGNPLIDHGASGAWDDEATADPHLHYVNGYWWMLYMGGGGVGGTGTRKWHSGLALRSNPEGPWVKHPSNPVLQASSSGWDEMGAWRGGLYFDGDNIYGVYGGLNDDLSEARGGSYTLTGTPPASPPTLPTVTTLYDSVEHWTDMKIEVERGSC